MKTIDFDKPYTLVGGRLPVKYVQNGYAYDTAGKSLGRCTETGERKNKPVPEQQHKPAVL